MTHEQYRAARQRQSVIYVFDNSRAMALGESMPPKYSGPVHAWSWAWMLSIIAFIVLAFFTFGISLVGLITVSPFLKSCTKEAAVQYALAYAEVDEKFYNYLIDQKILRIQE
jgi:hypothetical protein